MVQATATVYTSVDATLILVKVRTNRETNNQWFLTQSGFKTNVIQTSKLASWLSFFDNGSGLIISLHFSVYPDVPDMYL